MCVLDFAATLWACMGILFAWTLLGSAGTPGTVAQAVVCGVLLGSLGTIFIIAIVVRDPRNGGVLAEICRAPRYDRPPPTDGPPPPVDDPPPARQSRTQPPRRAKRSLKYILGRLE